jgi:cysteinyl-tRNA synthetase
MLIFDSVAKTKRTFTPMREGEVSLYVCGPTVYDDAHLGHAKSALVFDLLSRVLQANGYRVKYARNITDIDDKIINKAQETGLSIKELTDKYTEAYHHDMSKLGVKKPDIEPKATESLKAMFAMIKNLIDAKHAYQTPSGDVYFDTSSDAQYLSISGRHQEESQTQNRVESSTEKKHNADFALWKRADADALGFDSPFGKGRPGWHLECSAMIEKHLADSTCKYAVDIHGGGADLLFPHHENEAAQTRCSTNHEIAAYWMHNGFVNIDGEKMSKSLGNSFFLKDALKLYDGEVLRFYLLSTHYRSNFNFNEEDLLAAKKRLDKIYRLKKRLFGLSTDEMQTEFQTQLLEALSDDLNISFALSLIDAMVVHVNEILDTSGKHKELKKAALADLAFVERILGFGGQNPFGYFQFGVDETAKNKIEMLIEQRNTAKKAKDFATADSLREQILSLGVSLMDTPHGTFWERC